MQGKFLAMTEQFLDFAPRYLGHIDQNDLFRNSVAAQKPLSEVDSERLVSDSLTGLSCQLLGVVAPTRIGIDPHPDLAGVHFVITGGLGGRTKFPEQHMSQ